MCRCWTCARAPFDRARQLAPGDADTLMAFAAFCARNSRFEEARRDAGRAMELDRLNPSAFRIAAVAATVAGDLQGALTLIGQAIALNPSGSLLNLIRGDALFRLGRLDEARLAYADERTGIFSLTGIALVDQAQGDEAAARKGLAAVRTQFPDTSWYQQAQILARLGETDAALTALEQAWEVRDAGLAQLATDWFLTGLEGQPRFQALRGRIGFA
jgi:tetratricopeptide (TPR) repeat protein